MDIQIENLTKSYGPQKAVNNINFDVKTGEVLGFLGPNGAGKSTTMKMITGYIGIEKGDIRIGGKSVTDPESDFKQHIGYLPENNPLYLDMPIIDYLEFCAALQGMEKAKINDRIKEMIGLCGLNREKHKKIGELSKGYRQRVGLAQAMIHDPEILILDEPTTGLDPNQIIEIRKLIRDLGKEKTVILSTHILPEVEATCDRILIINRGNIVANGTPETLRKQAQGNEVLKLRIEDGDVETILKSLNALDTVQEADLLHKEENLFEVQSVAEKSSKRKIFNLCVEKKWVLTELTPLETKLEDIFRNLTVN
ncbi:ATP-binding cassette domain-containing protein [Zobellia galactanivorans]|uniref:ATP-binding cassette domain-containing protein n=1 Tax=Zobellia galactanivorans (strain DSM 12802 / CCUG 47099 / CIP 106680 / NCIMB 13871 / Dsij) TaxID=63186 RepID=UPI001C0793A9|nr:ATP-binding cassette domain-containing protein [Zobellia galactanivorans]MBU3028434.1 ATP-binding cassette domain-containing protein [Zobellia galactanivorans]